MIYIPTLLLLFGQIVENINEFISKKRKFLFDKLILIKN